MSNAMGLTFMVLAMYSVMGVSLFGDLGEEKHFKTFSSAVFTLFQFSTGDGWSDVVRGLFDEEPSATAGTSIFFVSFMIIVSLILMQVVIAVLLEEFSKISDNSNIRRAQTCTLRRSPRSLSS
jgi:hypothetical protein